MQQDKAGSGGSASGGSTGSMSGGTSGSTGMSGGAVPDGTGSQVVLSLGRMRAVREVDAVLRRGEKPDPEAFVARVTGEDACPKRFQPHRFSARGGAGVQDAFAAARPDHLRYKLRRLILQIDLACRI